MPSVFPNTNWACVARGGVFSGGFRLVRRWRRFRYDIRDWYRVRLGWRGMPRGIERLVGLPDGVDQLEHFSHTVPQGHTATLVVRHLASIQVADRGVVLNGRLASHPQ